MLAAWRRTPCPRRSCAGSHEDDEWVVLGIEDVGALTPERPWRDDELDRTLGLLTLVAESTAAMPPELVAALPPAAEAFPGLAGAWQVFAARAPRLTATSARPPRSPPDCPSCRARASCTATPATTTCCSAPTAGRCCATGTGRAAGPVWIDVVDVLVSAYGDGVDVEPLLAEHPLTAEVPAEEIDVWLAAYAGWMRRAGELPLAPELAVPGRPRAAGAPRRPGRGCPSAAAGEPLRSIWGRSGAAAKITCRVRADRVVPGCAEPRASRPVNAIESTEACPVANIKSQIKRNKQNLAAHERNKSVKSALKTAIRRFKEAAESGDAEKARVLAADANKKLDKAASKGVIHKNQAANRKSAIAKQASSL